MVFEHTLYLLLLTVVPIYGLGSIRSYRKSSRWLHVFARRQKRAIPYMVMTIFFCMAITAFTIALAEPKIQYEKVYFNRSSIEIAFGIDVSKSMLAEDVSLPPMARKHFRIHNRLNRARYFALNFLSQLHGERIGAFIFAKHGIEIIPLTRDYAYCRYIFKHINDVDITIPGSDLSAAIRTGIAQLENSRRDSAKFIVLISDGEDIRLDKSALDESARQAAAAGIKIFTIGIGTGNGVLIPIRNTVGTSTSEYYMDADGSNLKTRLIPDTLRNIAALTGGQYFHVADENSLKEITAAVLSSAKAVEQTKSVELEWFYLSPVFLMAGIGFFAVGVILDR